MTPEERQAYELQKAEWAAEAANSERWSPTVKPGDASGTKTSPAAAHGCAD